MDGAAIRVDGLQNHEQLEMDKVNHATSEIDEEGHASPLPTGRKSADITYGVEDVPPWYLCILLGFQHSLIMFGSTVAVPFVLAGPLCIEENKAALSQLISTQFFVCSLATLIQITVGTRLPIIQGGSFAYVSPALAILSLPQWKCGAEDDGVSNFTSTLPTSSLINTTAFPNTTQTSSTLDDRWMLRVRELQGAIIVATIFQVVVGFSGLMGLILRFFGPLTIAPTIALIGLSLFGPAADYAAKHWWIAIMTTVLIILFSQYLRNVMFPCPSYQQGKGCTRVGYPLFSLFPVILSIAVSWVVCIILTVTDVLPKDPKAWGYGARTDSNLAVLEGADWFRFPYPGQWGVPTVSSGGVFGMLAGVIASMIESIGDYYACARLAGAPPPPIHAVNRGIGIEGIGCILAGAWGSGNAVTSYSENIGAIGITKVASRRVMYYAVVFMALYGVFGKFGALFVTLPEPVMGGVFLAMFGMSTAVGISTLQFADMNSSRNIFIVGFAFFFGLCLPQWFAREGNEHAIQTGSDFLNNVFTVLLKTGMFVAGAVAFVLDNTIPGTDEERGILRWRESAAEETASDEADDNKKNNCYDLPFGMTYIRRWKWTKYIPVSPTFAGTWSCNKRRTSKNAQDDDTGCCGAGCRKRRKDANITEMSSAPNPAFQKADEDVKTV